MINFLTIPSASKRALISSPSYYRLAAEWLMPPAVKLAKARSAVIEDELDAVLRARAIGASNEDIRCLVKHLVQSRTELFGGDAASKEKKAVGEVTTQGVLVDQYDSDPNAGDKAVPGSPKRKESENKMIVARPVTTRSASVLPCSSSGRRDDG